MATYYFRNSGTNWGTPNNWSLSDGGPADGTVPTSSDNAIFTANSGECSISFTAANCLSINFTGYSNTITIDNTLTIFGNVTLSANMTIMGSSQLRLAASGTLTSNGKTLPIGLSLITSNATYTLTDNWTVLGTFAAGSTSVTYTLNGNSLYLHSSISFNTGTIVQGTTHIILAGTGTWSATGGGQLRNNVTIDTAGTITVSGTVDYNTGTLTYTTGTVITTGSTLVVGASTTLNTGSLVWNGVNFKAAATYTLNSDFRVGGGFNATGSLTRTINGSNIYFGGNVTFGSGTIIQGTSTIVFNGTGLFSPNSSTTVSNIVFNTAGTLTFAAGTFLFGNRTITYTAGTIVVTGCLLSCSNGITLNTNGMIWENVFFAGSNTITLNSLFSVSGILDFSVTGTTTTFGGTSGFSCSHFRINTGVSAKVVILKTGISYFITSNFSCIGATLALPCVVRSSTPGVGNEAILTVSHGVLLDLSFLNANSIDSSLGKTVWSYKANIIDSKNWNVLPNDVPTVDFKIAARQL